MELDMLKNVQMDVEPLSKPVEYTYIPRCYKGLSCPDWNKELTALQPITITVAPTQINLDWTLMVQFVSYFLFMIFSMI